MLTFGPVWGATTMKLREQYAYDVFLSYAYDDNRPPPYVKRGWVSTLRDCLEVELNSSPKGSNQIPDLDRHGAALRATREITPAIRAAVRASAALVVVLSSSYLESPWCKIELHEFLDAVDREGGDRTRVFVVRLRDRAADDPPVFAHVPGYKFWTEDEQRRVRRLGDPRPVLPRDRHYYERVQDLAEEIHRTLSQPVAEQLPSPYKKLRGTVYLARVAEGLVATRDEVRRYLAQSGLDVLPEPGREPDSATSFASTATRDLKRSDLFVQLLDAEAGGRSLGFPAGYDGLEYRLAQEAGTPVLQWRRARLALETVTDPVHRTLLDGPAVIASGIEAFKKMIADRFATLGSATAQVPAVTDVFVHADATDLRAAEVVSRVCRAGQVGATLSPRSGSPSEVRQRLQSLFTTCDALILIYGTSTSQWIRLQWLMAIKYQQYRSPNRPLRTILLRIPPPPRKEELGFDHALLKIVDCPAALGDGDDQPVEQELGRLILPLLKGEER